MMAVPRKTLIRRMFEAAGPQAVNLGLGEPAVPTPEPIAQAGIEAIRQGRTGYTATAGLRELREAVAPEQPDRVVITTGSQEALFASLTSLVAPGKEVLVPDPGYPAYPNIVELLGGIPRPYRLNAANGYRLDADALLGLAGRATCAVLLNGPANPTGATYRRPELERLVAGLAERSIPFVSDEIYAGLSWTGPPVSPADINPDGGLVVSGLSKSLAMTGWRVGWASGPERLTRPLAAVHQHLVTCAPAVSQAAAMAAFGEPGRRAAAAIRAGLERNRERMDRELRTVPGIRYGPPDGGFYYFVQVDGCEDSERLACRILEREQVLTIPGAAFGPGGEGCLRLSFAGSEEEIRLGLAGLRRGLAQEN